MQYGAVKPPHRIYAGMAELADAPDLGSGEPLVQVQVLLPAPIKRARCKSIVLFLFVREIGAGPEMSQSGISKVLRARTFQNGTFENAKPVQRPVTRTKNRGCPLGCPLFFLLYVYDLEFEKALLFSCELRAVALWKHVRKRNSGSTSCYPT